MNNDDLRKLEQNAYRDSMKDGIAETLGGFMFLLTAIMFKQPSFIGIFVVFYILLLPRLVEVFREKHTYPRIGYVKLKTKESDFSIGPFLLLITIAVVLTGVSTQLLIGDIFNLYNWLTQIPITLGVIMFGPSIFLVEKTGSNKYWMFGIFSTVLGIVVSYLVIQYPATHYLDSALAFCMILGTALAIGGLIKLAYFLRAYPILDSQEDVVSEQ
ncbi:MAG: hypothetical protein ACW98Y_05010 [Candidatus Thorarchaeota archaeon]|jgi:hypothetical protein